MFQSLYGIILRERKIMQLVGFNKYFYNYEYMAKSRWLLAIEKYMFQPIAAIKRLTTFCYKSYI